MWPRTGALGIGLIVVGACARTVGNDLETLREAICDDQGPRSSGWIAFEAEVVRLTNVRRVAGATCGGHALAGQPALRVSASLTCAARRYSADMVARSFFAHRDPDGTWPIDRITAAGYDSAAGAENLALGQQTPAEVVASWMVSEGHCRNIMNPAYQDIGVGFYAGDVEVAGTRYANAWSQVFGTAM